MEETKDVHKDIFEASHTIPVVVQFYANWCGPCKMIKPVMEALAENAEGRWKLAMVNIETQPGLVTEFQVQSIPTVIMFHKDEPIARFKGGKSSSLIQTWLDNNLPVMERGMTRSIPEHQDIDTALRTGDLETAQKSILNTLIGQYQDVPLLKLLSAVSTIGKNNNQARATLELLDREGPLGHLVKKAHDLIDLDDDEKDVHTPTSSPVSSKANDVHATIDIKAIDVDLLNELVHRGINEVRSQKGAAALQNHPILTSAALDHNDYMIRFDQLSHHQDNPKKRTVVDRIRSFGGDEFASMGENIQYKGFLVRTSGTQKEIITNTYHQTALEIVDNWVKSPGHYRNLINPEYKFVGTSVGYNPEDASLFATQVFGA